MVRTGRPRTFDRNEAITQAMNLFWQHGFESTTLAMLRSAIGGGINAPSFYAAFKSKELLFKECVDRYFTTFGQVSASLWDDTMPPRQAIEISLRRSAKMQTDQGHPSGCLLVISANISSPAHVDLQRLIAGLRDKARDGFERCVERAVSLGDLPADTDVTAYAAIFHTFLHGLTLQARDGVSGQTLDAAVSEIMASWDSRTKSARRALKSTINESDGIGDRGHA